MSIPTIRKALERAVAALTPALTTVWQGGAVNPRTDSGPIQEVAVLWAEPINDEYGGRARQEGVLQVTVSYPAKDGQGAAEARAQVIADAFPRNLPLVVGSLTVSVLRTPHIMSGFADAGRWKVPVRVAFTCQIPADDEAVLDATLGAYGLALNFPIEEVSDPFRLITAADDGKLLSFTDPALSYVYVDAGLPADFVCALANAGGGLTVIGGSARVVGDGDRTAVLTPGGFAILRRVGSDVVWMQRGDALAPDVQITRPDFSNPDASGLVALLLT